MSDNCNNTITLKGNKKEIANFLEGIQDTPVKAEGFVGISNVFDTTKEEFQFTGNNGGWFGDFGEDFVSFTSATYPPLDVLRVASKIFTNVIFYIRYYTSVYQNLQGCSIFFRGNYIDNCSSEKIGQDNEFIYLDIDLEKINLNQNVYKDDELVSKAVAYYYDNEFGKAYEILQSVTIEEYSNPYALYLLGEMYDLGNYVSKNLKLAIKYYTLAANGGNKYAMYNLGNIFINKDNVEFDEQKGLNLITNSAKRGHSNAIEFINLENSKNILD